MNQFSTVVLHHGLFGGDKKVGRLKFSGFKGIDRAIIGAGYSVVVSSVHPTAGIERRARELKNWIVENCPGRRQRVVIVAHSLGGLDARYMISRLGMADRVDSLITVCTPHRGSPYANWCAKNLGRKLRGFQLMKFLGLDVDGISDLTTQSCARFNEEILDVPEVRYFSISAWRPWQKIAPFNYFSWKIVHDAEGKNDGLVSLSSAVWGEHLATWAADHLHAINRRYVPEVRQRTGDIAPYYLEALKRVCGEAPVTSGRKVAAPGVG
jgi:triacylglycerol lipase